MVSATPRSSPRASRYAAPGPPGGVRARAACFTTPGSAPPRARGGGSDLAAARRRALVRRLLDELPEEQAEALALRVALGWSLKEIAETTGTPLNTVRSRMRLAKEALRRRIGNDPDLADELGVQEKDA